MPITMTIECNNPEELQMYLAAMNQVQAVASPEVAPVADNDNDKESAVQEDVDPPKKPRRSRAKKQETVEAKAEPKAEEKENAGDDDKNEEPSVDLPTIRARTVALAAHAQSLDPENATARQELVKSLIEPFGVTGIGKLDEKDYASFNIALDEKGAELGMKW